MPALEGISRLEELFRRPEFTSLQHYWKDSETKSDMHAQVGETFYRELFNRHPVLMDYFSATDMDSLALHLAQSLEVIFKAAPIIGKPGKQSSLRKILEHLGDMHRKLLVPTWAYPLIGEVLVDIFDFGTMESKEISKAQYLDALKHIYSYVVR